MENIFYAQLYLATKAISKFVSIKDNCYNWISFTHEYKEMPDRYLPFRTKNSSPDEINKREIERMKQSLYNN